MTQFERPLRAAIYLRISQDASGEGLAVDRQRSDCERIVQERGWETIGTYSDTVSASKRTVKRESYDRMLADYKAGAFDALVCWDLDRLTRQPRQLEDWIEQAEDKGLIIVTANGEADLSNDNGRLFARIKASVARSEIERKGARQRSKNEQRRAAGQPVPGKPRYGYEHDNMTLVPDEAAVVLRAFEDIRDGKSLRSTAIGLGWRTVRLRDTLTNPSYAGSLVYKKTELPSTLVTPIVSRELFDAVGAILADPARKTSPGSTIRYLATGIAECGVCSAKLHHQNEYICSASTAHVFIQKKQLDQRIAEEVFQWIVEHPDAESAGDTVRLRKLLLESAEISRRRGVVQELAQMEGADLAQVAKDLAKLGREGEKVTAAIQVERGLNARHSVLEQVRGEWWARREINEYTELEEKALAEWPTHWAGLGLDVQREIVRSMFSVRVDKGRGFERVHFTWFL